ncbi:MAG: hypothetical protein Q9169_003527 [Polycauliona sp. 2 TL-2023]
MAEEPQPPNIHSGHDPTEDSPATAPPASAEDRKAAAALSSLDDDSATTHTKTKNIDQEALAKAISRLELSSSSAGAKADSTTTTGGGAYQSEQMKAFEEGRRKRREERERVARVKVEVGDVGLLVQELELSKVKATDLLKTHEGDAVKAIRAYITTPV